MNSKIKVAVVITDKKGRILLIKEKLEKKPSALWNVVKGTYDGGETIFEAAKRECMEEASLKVELTHSLGVYVSEKSGELRVQFNFLAKTDNIKATIASQNEQKMRNEDIEEVRWFTKEEIEKMDAEQFVSTRTLKLLQGFLLGEFFPLNSYKQVDM